MQRVVVIGQGRVQRAQATGSSADEDNGESNDERQGKIVLTGRMITGEVSCSTGVVDGNGRWVIVLITRYQWWQLQRTVEEMTQKLRGRESGAGDLLRK